MRIINQNNRQTPKPMLKWYCEGLGENMSAILSLSAIHYINMKNNAALNMMKINNARMNMLSQCCETTGGIGNCPVDSLCAFDTQMEMDSLTNSIQYQYAKAMLEQIKKQQKDDAKRFSTFA